MGLMLLSIEELMTKVGKQNLILAAVALVVLLVLLVVFRQMRLKKRRKEVASLENRLSAIKSLPIQYRLGRVQNIAKNTPEILEQYNQFEQRYEKLISVQKDEIAILLNEIDEKLYAGKMYKVSGKLNELRNRVETFERDANQLLSEIEAVTEIENIQRISIIRVKEKYRSVQENYANVRYKLEDAVPGINAFNEQIDQDFVTLETMMNQQRFDEAKKQCEMINDKVDFLNANIRDLPTYLSLANGYIPAEIEKIQNRIVDLKSRGFSLTRIDAENRVLNMQDSLVQVEDDIQSLEIANVGQTLNEITAEIAKLNDEFETEEAAQSEFNDIWKDIFDKTSELSANFDYAKEELTKLRKLYVIEDESLDISLEADHLQDILADMTHLKELINSKEFSYQEVVGKLKQLALNGDEFEAKLKHFFEARDEMYLTEKRALDELENINIVLLEIKSQIKNKQLPMINESYKDYISDSYKKANEIQFLCKSRPIILDNLTQQVDIARDIIYKLYDNIHNLIVTADMVEEAIVFGNRYRSSFLEVNTELTKAEVLYRNGEYTKALSTAVDIIEKIKPGSYERLIKKNNLEKDPRAAAAA